MQDNTTETTHPNQKILAVPNQDMNNEFKEKMKELENQFKEQTEKQNNKIDNLT